MEIHRKDPWETSPGAVLLLKGSGIWFDIERLKVFHHGTASSSNAKGGNEDIKKRRCMIEDHASSRHSDGGDWRGLPQE